MFKKDEQMRQGFMADALGCYFAPEPPETRGDDNNGYPEKNAEDETYLMGSTPPDDTEDKGYIVNRMMDDYISPREQALRDVFWD